MTRDASGRSLGPLVGRDAELAELDGALSRVLAGAPVAVELVGEPGIGKSRLLGALCRRAADSGFLVLEGRAAEFESDIPFGVIVDALNDHAGSLTASHLRDLDADALHELASILPSLSAHAEEPWAVRAEGQRYRTHYAVRALLELLATTRPILLALDDIHWADPASLEVMAHVVRRFHGPLLIAFAYRPGRARLVPTFGTDARLGSALRFELAPLTPDEADALLDPALDRAARSAIYRTSGGNPFYLGELARSARASAGPDPVAPSEGWPVPAGVLAVIEEELARLPAEHRRVLEAAAIAGESFEPALVSAIAEDDEATVLAAFDALEAMALIRPAGTTRAFRFRHPIVRRAAYDAAPGGWRVGAHARAAIALTETGAPVAERANHVASSAAPGDRSAIAVLLEAAATASPRAPRTAGRWFLIAARLLPADDGERAPLLGRAGALLTSGGGFEEALGALEEALTLTREDEHVLRATLVARHAEARRRGGMSFEDAARLREAVDAFARIDDERGLDVRLELAMNRYWHADLAEMHALATEVLATARARADTLFVCNAAALRSLADGSTGAIDEATMAFEEAWAASEALADERFAERIFMNHYIAEAALRLERADAALAIVHRGLDVARATGQEATSRSWWGATVHALLLRGDVRGARQTAERVLEGGALDSDDWRMLWFAGAYAAAASSVGDAERALTTGRDMVERAERTYQGTFLPDLGRVATAAGLSAVGDHEAVLAELGPMADDRRRWVLDLHAARGWELLIRSQLSVGDVAAAEEASTRAYVRDADARLPQRAATLAAAHVEVLLAQGEPSLAVKAADAALQLGLTTSNPVLVGRCRTVLGNALAASGDRVRGVDELASAERSLASLGAIPDADRAARELRRLGKRVTRRARHDRGAGVGSLSPREREVAEAVAAGKTNRQIAAALFLSEKTIESHLTSIYLKLDVHSRAALATLLARLGTDVA